MNIDDAYGNIALIAVKNGKKEILNLLLENQNININAQSKINQTALIWATKLGYKNIVALLISRPDINLNLQDYHGDTALTHAIYKSCKNITEMLLQAGADLSNKNEELIRNNIVHMRG